MRLLLVRLAIAAGLMIVWEAVSGRLIDTFFISKPSIVASDLAVLFGTGAIYPHLWATVEEAAYGYVIGAVTGIGAALVLSRLPVVEAALNPFIMAFYGIPRIALAPLFIIWFGIGLMSKVVVVVSVVFFIAFVNTLAGLREVDLGLVSVLKAMGATERQLFTKVRIPAAAPWVFVGLRVGVPYALVGAIIGELLAASRGLGYLIQRYSGYLDTGNVMALIITLGALVIIFNEILGAFQARIFRWKPVEEGAHPGAGL